MKHTKKRLLSIFLITMMLCSLIPAPAFAATAIAIDIDIAEDSLNISKAQAAEGVVFSLVEEGTPITSDVAWSISYLTEGDSEPESSQTFTSATVEFQTDAVGHYGVSVVYSNKSAWRDIYVTEEGYISDSGETRYTLGFDVDGGTPIAGISAAPGHEIDLTDKVQTTKDGHTLAGVYMDAGYTQLAPNTIEMTSDVTLYVKWTVGTDETIINADGSITTITTNADGSTEKITAGRDGTVTAEATISETDGAALIANAQATGAVQVDFAVAGNVTAATVNLPQNVSDAVDAQGLQLYVSTPIGTATYQGVGDAAQQTNLKAAGVATAGDVRSITLTKDNGQPKLIFTDGISKEILNVYGGAAVYVKGSNATDDAAGSKISESMKDTITGLDAAQKNAEDGIMLIQTAEGTLTEVHDMLNRMNTLAIQAANGTDDNVDRVALQKEVESLTAEIARIGSAGTFDAEKLLGINISTKQDARGAVGVIEDAIQQVSACRADFGAMQNRLEYNTNKLGIATEKIQAEENAVRDTDVADEMMAYTKNNILIQSAQAMLAQANEVPQGVLQLLQ